MTTLHGVQRDMGFISSIIFDIISKQMSQPYNKCIKLTHACTVKHNGK